MFITLYVIVTRLPNSLRSIRDHFLTLDPTVLTVDLLKQHLLAAETSVVAVGAAHGTPRTPFFEGTSGLLLLVRSAAAARARVAGVGAVATGVVVGAVVEVVEVVEVVAVVGMVAGVGALVAALVAAVGVAVVAAVGVVAVGLELLSEEVLAVARGSSSSVRPRPHRPSSFVSGFLSVGRLGAELLRSGVAIFDLDYDAILAAMYALSVSAEGDCYLCVPPDPGTKAAALGASKSALPGTAPAEALHTFTLDSGVRVRSGSSPLLVSSPVAPESPVAPPPWSPLPATPSWHALLSPSHRSSSSSFPLTTAPLQTLHMDVWGPSSGCRAFVGDTSADKLSARAIPCVFLGFPPDAPGWKFYHPTSRRVIPSQDVTFDELVPFYRLFPYRSAPPLPPPLFLAPDPPPVDPLPTQGPAPSGVPQVDPLPGTVPVEVAGNSGATRRAASEGAERGVVEPGGAESEGAGSGGAEPGGAERGGAELAGVERGGTESEGAESGGAEPRGTASSGGPTGALPCLSPRPEPLSPQQLREWFAQRTHLLSGASGAGDSAASDHGVGGAGVSAGVGGTGGTAAAGRGGGRTMGTRAAATGSVGGTGAGRVGAGDPAGPGGAGVGSTEAGGTGASGVGAGGAKAGGILAGGAGAGAGDTGAVDPRAGGAGAGGAVSGGTSAGGTLRSLPYFSRFLSQPPLPPASPLPAPSPYNLQTRVSRPVLPVCTAHRVPRPRPPPILGTSILTHRHSSVPLRVSLLFPPASSLPTSIAASALVAKLLDFAATCRLDYATALVAESESANPPSVGGECALGTDVLESRAATGQRRAVVG
ncbi:unnamed protein product [Closterium sp. NIES-53]